MSNLDPQPQPPLFKKPELVPGWRQCWRWFSTQSMALALAIQGTWAMLDSDQRATINPHFILGLTVGVLIFGLIGNIIKQKLPKQDNQ